MTWMELTMAGILEVFWSTMMKWSGGFSKISYSFYTAIGIVASSYFLSKAIKSLPMGLSYPIWTGTGIVSSIVIDMVLFHDELNLSTRFFVGMLLTSIIGIKVTSGH